MIFLCLGDSLTAGYPGYNPSYDGISQGYGNNNSQYEFWLKQKCIEFMWENEGKDLNIYKELIFINKGIPGELTSDLLARIQVDLISVKPKPDYSIIIGGTNDLGWGRRIEEIFENIKKLHEISRKNDIISIGATIPPIRMEQSNIEYNKSKIQLNKLLKSYYNENDIPFVDLYNKMRDIHGNLRKECAYIDGLHFSVEGYKQMGFIIFEDAIKEIIGEKFELLDPYS
ncbi:MAG: GDSL-type esterase/lipase family protein [Promethearchaeota archaeon]